MRSIFISLLILFTLCCANRGQSQVVFSKSYDIEYDGFESRDVFEHEGHYYLAGNDFSYLSESDLFGYLFRLSEDLSVIDTLEIDYEPIIGRSDMARGEFMVVQNQLEFVGMGSYRYDLSNGQQSLQDTTFFFRMQIADDFSISSIEKIPVSVGYHYLVDLIYDEAHEQYLFSVTANFVLGYWIGAVDYDFTTAMRSDNQIHAFDAFLDNPLLVTKIILDGESILLKTNQLELDVYNQSLEFDSVYSIPQVDWSTPFYAWMSKGVELIGDTYLQASNQDNRTHVLHLDLPGVFIQEFSIFHSDSSVTDASFKCLDIDEDLNLYLGMHIRSNDEDYPKHLKAIKCDTLGNIFWQTTFGEGLEVKYAHRQILSTSDGGILMLANRFTDPETDFANGLILYKLNNLGDVTSVANLALPQRRTHIYPNPSYGFINLSSTDIGSQYSIVNLSGQVLESGILMHEVIDVSALKRGTYLIWIDDGVSPISQTFVVK